MKPVIFIVIDKSTQDVVYAVGAKGKDALDEFLKVKQDCEIGVYGFDIPEDIHTRMVFKAAYADMKLFDVDVIVAFKG